MEGEDRQGGHCEGDIGEFESGTGYILIPGQGVVLGCSFRCADPWVLALEVGLEVAGRCSEKCGRNESGALKNTCLFRIDRGKIKICIYLCVTYSFSLCTCSVDGLWKA